MLRKGCVALFVLALWTGWAGVAPAQDVAKPLAVVSYAGYEQAMKTLEFVGQLAGKPDLAAGMEQMLKMMTGGQGLQGLDPKQPWGLVVLSQGTEIDGYAFFPVTDLKQLLAVLAPFIGPATESGGLFKIDRGSQTFYVKKQGNWAFAAVKEARLAKLPDDPARLLGDLPKDYLWAARLFVAHLPSELREMLVSQIQMMAQMAAQQAQGPEQELVRERMQRSLQQLERAVKELDQITLGLQIDRQARQAHLDIQVTALAGTKAAAGLAASSQLKTDHAGFLDPKATITGNWIGDSATSWRGTTNVEDINKQLAVVRKQALQQLEKAGLAADDMKAVEQILDDLLDVARQTLLAGRIDGGVRAVLEPTAASAVIGGRIAGGAKLNSALKKLSELATKAVPDAANMINMNAGTLAGMQLHTASIPLPPDVENRQQAVKLVGENLEVVVAAGDESAFLAVGRDALSELKKVVERSQAERGKAAMPLTVSVAFVPLSRFIAEVGDERTRENFSRIHEQVKGLAGKDALRLTATPVERGLRIRLEAEEAVLKAAAASAPLGGPLGGPSP